MVCVQDEATNQFNSNARSAIQPLGVLSTTSILGGFKDSYGPSASQAPGSIAKSFLKRSGLVLRRLFLPPRLLAYPRPDSI